MSSSKSSLAARTVAGASWIMLWRAITRVLGIVNTVVLVRLLSPADFGLIALATAFAQSVDWLTSMGVTDALIRSPTVGRSLYNTGFTLNLIRGTVMGVIILLVAAPVAVFFEDARLVEILQVLAVSMAAAGLENIGIVDFRRDMDFRKELLLLVVPRLISIAASIAAAFLLMSYWALVVGIVVNRAIRLVLTYWYHPYRPGIDLSEWRAILGFSFWSWMSALVTMGREKCDAFVIGRVLGPGPVGVFAVGNEIGTLPSTELLEPATAALFSGFSRAHREGSDVSKGYFRAISLALLLMLPAGIGMSLIAAPLVHVAFGPQWHEAVFLVEVFALLGCIRAIGHFSSVLLVSAGQVSVQFRILTVNLIVKIGLLLALIGPLGLVGAAIASAVSIVLSEIMFGVTIFRRFELRLRDLLLDIWRPVTATAVMALALFALGLGWAPAAGSAWGNAVLMVQAIGAGVLLYAATLVALWVLSGKPDGVETVFFKLASDMLGRVRHRLLPVAH